MKQYNAIWPLPGGVDNYFEALRQILAHLALITDDGEQGITTRYGLATFQAKIARLVGSGANIKE